MTINWFSPLPPSPSASAGLTAEILPALARRARVVLWTSALDWAPELAELARVQHYVPSAPPWAEINAADVTVYHWSNSWLEHRPIWQMNQAQPGIVILSEWNFQPLFAGLLNADLLSRKEYFQMMNSHHPVVGARMAAAFLAGARSLEAVGSECSLLGVALENALGVMIATPEIPAEWTTDLPVAHRPWPAPESGIPAALETRGRQIELWVEGLLELIEHAHANRAQEAAYWTAGGAGRALAPWYSETAERFLVPRLAEQVNFLCEDSVSGR